MGRIIFLALAVTLCSTAQIPVALPESAQVFVIEADTGQVFYEQNADQKMHPSSMTKMVTVMPVFQRMKEGRLKMTDLFSVSEKAWRREGSRMFLDPSMNVSVADLLKGVIIQSGNDAATALAEGLAGTEEAFAHEMTELAHRLGATHTHFTNASGLPDENHYTTARDLGRLAQQLIRLYPNEYAMFSEKEFTFNAIKQANRNPLLRIKDLGADGIKTGSSSKGGYGLVGSAEMKGLRVIVVMNGLKTPKDRRRLSEALLRWVFREYQKQVLIKAGTVVERAPVWLGSEPYVSLTVSQDIALIVSAQERRNIKMILTYFSPLEAPLQAGQEVGKIILSPSNAQYPLVVSSAVAEVGMLKRALSVLHYILWGTSR